MAALEHANHVYISYVIRFLYGSLIRFKWSRHKKKKTKFQYNQNSLSFQYFSVRKWTLPSKFVNFPCAVYVCSKFNWFLCIPVSSLKPKKNGFCGRKCCCIINYWEQKKTSTDYENSRIIQHMYSTLMGFYWQPK